MRTRTGVAGDDVALAAIVAVAMVAGTMLGRGPRPDALGVALLVAAALPIAVRRAAPLATLILSAVAAFAYGLLGEPGALYTVALAVALFAVADAGHRLVAVAGVAGVVGLFLAIGAITGRGHVTEATSAGWFAGWLVAGVVLGEVTRGRRAYVREVEERALEAERTREAEARRRADEERLRIARELHDILAHRIASISVQAGVGLHLVDRDPAQARVALAAINEASKEALGELRATLGLLRQLDESSPRRPVAGLARLDEVAATARAAGIRYEVVVHGERHELPARVDLAAFRIVQESVTNVLRHASARSVRVALTFEPAAVAVEVRDDGAAVPGVTSASGGHGVRGMRERAVALGGAFEAGPEPGGGFRVFARLPFEPAR